MSDQDRINAMVEEGKITPEEAEGLLRALEDAEAFETTMSDFEEEVVQHNPPPPAAAVGSAAGATRPAAEARTAAAKASPAAQSVPASAPPDLRWVRVSVLAGDLDIRADPSLSEPQVDGGNVTVSREGNDFVVAAAKRERSSRREGVDGLLEGIGELVSGIVGRIGGDLDIRVPEGFGVIIDSKSGDVDVQGVAFVKANLLAGDIDLREVLGVDLRMSAGDVDASLRLTEGQHRIKVSAGDVDVRLLPGSSVAVTGSVSMGDLDAQTPFKAGRTGMGGSLSGQLGEGAAKLELSVGAGDLDVRHG